MKTVYHGGVAYSIKDGAELNPAVYGAEQTKAEFEAARDAAATEAIKVAGVAPKNVTGLADNDIPQPVIDAALAASPRRI